MTPHTIFLLGGINMTSFELADELQLKESYLRSHWRLIVDRYAGYGITLVKIGRGNKANFGIKSYGDSEIRWEVKS